MADLDFDAFALVPKGHASRTSTRARSSSTTGGGRSTKATTRCFATVVLRLETAVSCLGSVGYGSFTSTRPLVPVIQRRHKHQARARVGVEVAEPLDYYYTRSGREAAFVRAETFATEYHAGPTTTFSQQEGACAYDAVTPDTSINRSLHDGGF